LKVCSRRFDAQAPDDVLGKLLGRWRLKRLALGVSSRADDVVFRIQVERAQQIMGAGELDCEFPESDLSLTAGRAFAPHLELGIQLCRRILDRNRNCFWLK
jgi:hypothetical protein